MKPSVIQHVDREYTYDYIPAELENGLLFQGIHRPVKGTSIIVELFRPAKIYFFFQNTWDGGYSEIFSNLKEWGKCTDTPQKIKMTRFITADQQLPGLCPHRYL